MTAQERLEGELIGKLLVTWRAVGEVAEQAEPGVFGGGRLRKGWRRRCRVVRGLVLMLAARIVEMGRIERGEMCELRRVNPSRRHQQMRDRNRVRSHEGRRGRGAVLRPRFEPGFPWRWLAFCRWARLVYRVELAAVKGFRLKKPAWGFSTNPGSVICRRYQRRLRAGLIRPRKMSPGKILRLRAFG